MVTTRSSFNERSVYRRVIGRGSTVFDANVIEHLYGAREAKKEMDVLIREIESRFGTIKKKSKFEGVIYDQEAESK
jgi:ribosomal protein S24E